MHACWVRENICRATHKTDRIAYLCEGGKKDVDEQKNLFLLFEIFINRMYSCISCRIKNKFISEKQ